MSQTPRTKAKLAENVGLLMDYFRKKYGAENVGDAEEMMLYEALSWTADDVERQMAERKSE
jgi:hypothetical protein